MENLTVLTNSETGKQYIPSFPVGINKCPIHKGWVKMHRDKNDVRTRYCEPCRIIEGQKPLLPLPPKVKIIKY